MIKSTCELAWAAGFFDGEGHVQSKHGRRILIGQTNIEPLERFRRAVNVGRVRGPYQHKTNKNANPHWIYDCSNGNELISIFNLIGDFLCSIKYNQFVELINNSHKQRGIRQYCKNGHDWTKPNSFKMGNNGHGIKRNCLECRRNSEKKRRDNKRVLNNV